MLDKSLSKNMLSKNKIKFVKSLELKKNRTETGLFVAEGEKIVPELLLSNLDVTYLAATSIWIEQNTHLPLTRCSETDIVSYDELKKISFLKTPQQVVCVAKIPTYPLQVSDLTNKLSLLLDTVQDPGNLGTILRIADWFGIEDVICSRETADAFNPKVVQSTMGAITRVKVYYENLEEILPEIKNCGIPIYGTTLNGGNIYASELTTNGIIMMGNESKGISPELMPYLNHQLFIPFFPEDQKRSESLNVGVATAIVCAEFRRRTVH
jgi:rRNA methylases